MATIEELNNKRHWEYVEWLDAYTPHINKWTDKDELRDIISNCVIINKLTGLVIHEDKKFITLVMHVSDEVWSNENVEYTKIINFIRIPIKWILKRVPLNSLIYPE